MTVDRLKSAFANLWNTSSDDNWIVGRLGWKTSTTTFDLTVTGMPSTFYVSLGYDGDLARTTAYDAVGVLQEGWVLLRMRRENGKLVIREASAYAAGGGGSGGGATNLDALTDVTLASPSDGQSLVYNAATGQWKNLSVSGAIPNPHGLSSGYHNGTLNWSLINFVGSNLGSIETRPHSALQSIGVDDHHPHLHPLVGTDNIGVAQHTASGLTTGNVVRATGPTTFAWQQLQHTDLGNVQTDQHHPYVHDIITGAPIFGVAHSVVGADYTVIGVHPANTLAVLPTSSAPGAAVSVLRTDANGGIQLDTNLLYVDGANNWVGINRTPSGAALDVIAFSNADHTQRIKQKSGQTGRMWRIEDTSGNELIVLDSVGNLQSGRPGFVSGLRGWQISPGGNAEFNNIWARGELHATVFVKDEVHATGGTFMVATAATLYNDAVIDSSVVDDDVLVVYSTPAGAGVPLQVVTTSGTFTGNELHVSHLGNYMDINDPPSGPAFYFQPGEIVRAKTEIATGVTDVWLQVNGAVQNTGYATYSVSKMSGTDSTLPKGSAVVSYGKQGDGRILMTSDWRSDLGYTPYIDVFTSGAHPWDADDPTGIIPRMRMGQLAGVGLPGVSGVSQWGMIAGKDLSDANSGYLIASNLQFSLYKVDIRLNNGTSDTGLWTADGNLKIGSNVGATATTGFQVITTGSRAGDVVVGNEATGNYLRWQQSTGILQVSGSLIVTDPGTTVTKTYVDTQDAAYDHAADLSSTGYAGIAQANAIAYSDARRIVGVSGLWDSPGTNRVRWGTSVPGSAGLGLAVVFATPAGSTRSIADPPAPGYLTISTRTYLYVNMSGSGTMTMGNTTSIATVSAANNVLIAVCDPSDSAVLPASARLASITVVAGSTYISGGNIFTGSITATNIASQTITTGNLASATIVSLNSTAYGYAQDAQTAAALDATTKAGTAKTDAQAYGDQYKLQGVYGTIKVTGQRSIAWGTTTPGGGLAVSLYYADGAVKPINDGSLPSLSTAARSYIYYNYGAVLFASTTALSSLSTTSSLIAVFDPGATTLDPGSLSIVGGATYISGNNIVTGSILSSSIKSAEIQADRMSVGYLGDMNGGGVVRTGTLEIDSASNIHSFGKTSYGGAPGNVAGFFIGYDATTYKVNIGNANTNLKWDGANLSLATNQAIGVVNTSTGQILSMFGPSATTGLLTLERATPTYLSASLLRSSTDFIAPQVSVNKLIQTGDTIWLQTPRVVTSAQTMPGSLGFKGEMCWGTDGLGATYLYLCYADNNWRRILFPTTTW